MEELKGSCVFEDVEAVDLLDAARTVSGKITHGIYCPPPGIGVDNLINWAMSELQLAQKALEADDRKHHSSNAVLHAKRAVSCLVDWYMQRDGFSLCKDPCSSASAKSELLVKRGVTDELTAKVLARAIRIRDDLEHRYTPPDVETAEDFVDLFRKTIRCMRSDSNPSAGACVFGHVSCGFHFGRETKTQFYGWLVGETVIVLATFADIPWIGVVIPETKDKAVVRKVPYSNVSVDTLLELLRILEERCGQASSTATLEHLRLFAEHTGLDG